jgi:hypothetical protein
MVTGTVSLTTGTPRAATVTFTGSAAFTGAGNYVCTAQNVTNTADRIQVTQATSSITVTSQNNANIDVNYICIGN